jgi:regulator of sigma E protease
LLTILAFVVVLGVVVMVHELGHFTVAKLAGVRVLEFGMGFPPRLFGVTRGDTTYTINLLPLGGFVRMSGEDDPTEQGSLAGRSARVRLGVLVAGSAMNVVLPLVLLTVFFMVPRSVPITDVVIREVVSGSPAEVARILPGDVVREVDGRRIMNSSDLRVSIQLRLGAESRWLLQRGGRLVEASLTPRVNPPPGEGSVGVLPADARVTVSEVESGSTAAEIGLHSGDLLVTIGNSLILFGDSSARAVEAARDIAPGDQVAVVVLRDSELVELALPPTSAGLTGMRLEVTPEERESKPIWSAMPASVAQMWEILVMFRNEVSRWLSGVRPEVAGPIGIAQLTGEAARSGASTLLFWTALLSMNLAIVNMLPLPALDGGRIGFVLLELVRGGRRVSASKERLVHLVGFAMFMTLIVALSVNDIQRIVGGGTP